jgi:hemerythrin-like domain-containing protein
MAARLSSAAQAWRPRPADLRRLGDPIEFIAEDHMRARSVYAAIEGFAAEPSVVAERVQDAMSFLREELPLHIEDEEHDLFPLLRRRCAADEGIAARLDDLIREHGRERQDAIRICDLIGEQSTRPGGATSREREELRNFVRSSRRHLILEDAIILPFARARLTRKDRDRLLASMLRRRGLDSLLPQTPS